MVYGRKDAAAEDACLGEGIVDRRLITDGDATGSVDHAPEDHDNY